MTSLLCMGGTKRSDASDNTECRPANIEKFLSESFSGQSRGGQGKARRWQPKTEAGILGRAEDPSPTARGQWLHCFGHWKKFLLTKVSMCFIRYLIALRLDTRSQKCY